MPATTLKPYSSKPITTELPTKITTDSTAICTTWTGVGLVMPPVSRPGWACQRTGLTA